MLIQYFMMSAFLGLGNKTYCSFAANPLLEDPVAYKKISPLEMASYRIPIVSLLMHTTDLTSAGASFQLFLGGQNFFYIFQCHRTIEKLEKNSTLYVVIWRYS